MVRRKNKWKFGFIFYILLLSVFTKSLPIEKSVSSAPLLATTNTNFGNLVEPEQFVVTTQLANIEDNLSFIQQSNTTQAILAKAVGLSKNSTIQTRDLDRQLRPEQEARDYAVQITIDGGNFKGRVSINIRINDKIGDPLVFHVEDLNIDSVRVGTISEDNADDTNFNVNDGVLEISPGPKVSFYRVIIEYNGQIRSDGTGIFKSDFHGHEYLGMNLYPTNARRVFPCMDDLRAAANVKFTFVDVPFSHIVTNSEPDTNLETADNIHDFRALQAPQHLWGMIAYDFNTIVIPTNDVLLVGRGGLNQDAQASIAIQDFFNTLNEWTAKPYFEIMNGQDGRMVIVALPDTSVDWHALSTVCIWEPYVLMELIHSVQQRKIGLVKLAEAMARQWFGFVIHPSNWRHQWVIDGLGTYASYEVVKQFQSGDDNTALLDMNAIFVTDVIQESLLRDGYRKSRTLHLNEDIYDESEIRGHINGLLKYKAPAIMRMLALTLGNEEVDFIQTVGQSLLNNLALEPISTNIFVDIMKSLPNEGTDQVGNIYDFLKPWINTRGYPLILVGLRQDLVVVTQEHFGFTASSDQVYKIPLTYTSSVDLDFSNVHPNLVFENMMTVPMRLSDDNFPIFNIQGQGYYRVNYEDTLWDRIIDFLQDPDRREQIHPLNRATFIDDALNLARGGKLHYEKALGLVATMEHETAYAPWKAYVRNMDFLRKRLENLVDDNGDLDPNIYTRMVAKIIAAAEEQFGFYPDPTVVEPAMTSLTRGLVMDHACRSNYQPCIAAAVDWFYDPNSDEPTVNPNIPKDIRPAVYCTMVREEDTEAIDALKDRLEIEPSHYERLVILQSLACSQNGDVIYGLLTETISDNSPYGVEERSLIFKAIVESSLDNTRAALNFIQMHTNLMRNQYGGSQKLEELIYLIAENAAGGITDDLSAWIDNRNNNIDESMDAAERAEDHARENIIWEEAFLEEVYNWIDENDAPKLTISVVLVSVTFIVTLFNS